MNVCNIRDIDMNVCNIKDIDMNVCNIKDIDMNVCNIKDIDMNVCNIKNIELISSWWKLSAQLNSPIFADVTKYFDVVMGKTNQSWIRRAGKWLT